MSHLLVGSWLSIACEGIVAQYHREGQSLSPPARGSARWRTPSPAVAGWSVRRSGH